MLAEKYVMSDPEHIFMLRQLDKFMCEHNGFIAGGCFKNLFNHENIKDVDVFFKNQDDFNAACMHFSNNKDFCSLYESNNVTAFKHFESGIVLELVRKIFGEPEEIINQFDFTIVKFVYYKDIVEENGEEITTYKVIYDKNFFEHLHLHRLIIDDKIPYPMSTFNRIIKYARYGYIACTETKQRIINALRSLSEDEILVPTNFYNGVD